MNSKVDKHISEQLNELYDECRAAVSDYQYFKMNLWKSDPKACVLDAIAEQVAYIDQALEVFQNAELITNDERLLCKFCAYQMQREAKRSLREYIKASA
jgi:hypothetical protein